MHILFGGVRVDQEQIVADGAAEQGVALGNVDKVATGVGRCRSRRVLVVELHTSLSGGEQSQDEAYERGLAGTSLAQDGSCAARSEVEGEILQNVAVAVLIAVGDTA